MRIVFGIVGALLLIAGLIWAVWIVGGVFSQSEGFTELGTLWPAMAFHAVTLGLGTALVGRAVAPQPSVEPQPAE